MRRKDREITDPRFINSILGSAVHGHLAMCDDGKPYVVPMNFAWSEGSIWLHCAKEGRKLDVMAKNPNVCFQVDDKTSVVESERACGWGMLYACVIVFGTASIIEDETKKGTALLSLMRHFKPDFNHVFTKEEINSIAIIEIKPNEITCKAREK